ncbi:MAG: hypothetical protein ACSLFP_02195 [Acidimicrobiales bacterium]
MPDLPWLVPAAGPEPERRRAERTDRAALDLAAVVAQRGGHLVLHEAVDVSFAFAPHHLPPGTVDLREGDALGAGLADPDAIVVSGAGIFIGTPVAVDPRWAQLDELGRHRLLLISSALSGAYFGGQVYGPRPGRFLDGVAEQVVGLAARLTYADGSVLTIERTTVGYRSSGPEGGRLSPSLVSLVAAVGGVPEQVTSELLDVDELLAVLADAGRLPPETLTLNGQRWRP